MNTNLRHLGTKAVITLLLAWTGVTEAAIRHVALDGSGDNGQSWATAYRSVQAAMDDPAVVDGDEIRIKQGYYVITTPILVRKAVRILGGFSGVNATRDPQVFLTTIDGGGNAWHGFAITANAVVDGLTVTGGKAFELEEDGGGMVIANCKATVTNCVFRQNSCRRRGGGIALVGASGTLIADCTFTENKAGESGGGIHCDNSDVTINACVFLRNEAGTETEGWGGGLMNDQGSPSILGCTFTGNRAPLGAGLCNANTTAYVEACTFADSHTASSSGGGVYNRGGAPTISRCLFHHNAVTHWGGAIADDASSAAIVNCIMWENSAMLYGGAVYIGLDADTPVTYPQLINCTMYANTATRGGGLYSYGAAATLWNCIVWGNQAQISDPGVGNNTQIWDDTTVAFHSDIEGDAVYPGGTNLLADPLFEDPQQGDFRLQSSSPCVDTGSNVPSVGSEDFEGNARIVDGRGNGSRTVDLGALELQGRVETNHLYRGEITHTIAYDSPDDTSATYIFTMFLETDDSVYRVEFRAPNGGSTYQIPNDPQTASGPISTFHRIRNGRHQWQYKAQLDNPTALGGYGNGVYRIIFYSRGASQYETQMSFLMPGSAEPVAQPMQRPVFLSPLPARAMGSPIILAWDECTDPVVNKIFLQAADPATGEEAIADVFTANIVESNPYSLHEGVYEVKCAFANMQEGTSTDGTPFSYGKTILVGQQIEVPYTAVYRFWSPITSLHFYTISESEKDWLISNYPAHWTFEGPVYSACSTPYHAGMLPVYRFWSGRTHFYTIDELEKERLLKEYLDFWTFEGIAFYAYPEGAQPSGCAPIYRFWNASDNSHFYTADEAEREKIAQEYGHIFTYEGIAYYAYP